MEKSDHPLAVCFRSHVNGRALIDVARQNVEARKDEDAMFQQLSKCADMIVQLQLTFKAFHTKPQESVARSQEIQIFIKDLRKEALVKYKNNVAIKDRVNELETTFHSTLDAGMGAASFHCMNTAITNVIENKESV